MTTYLNGEFNTIGEVVINNADCNVKYTYLYLLSKTSQSTLTGFNIAPAGTCVGNKIIMTFLPGQLRSLDKIILNIGVKGTNNQNNVFSTRIGCEPIVELGGTWTFTPVSANYNQGSCNLILAGTTQRKCTANGWEKIEKVCCNLTTIF